MALNRYYHNNFFPFGFDEFFAPTPFLMPRHSLFDIPRLNDEGRDSLFGGDWVRNSPGYTMTEIDGKYNIKVDLPGVKPKDINVELEHDGTVLHISGGRKIATETMQQEVRFDRRFTIGSDVDTEKMTANLADGVLTLAAPKREVTKPATRTIAVTEGEPAIEEKKGETK